MKQIATLRNSFKEYAWGSRSDIQDILGKSELKDRPIAELWLGTHPGAPSDVYVAREWIPLSTIIDNDPESALGKAFAHKFSKQLPFLFKILAAGKPLSIQVHPNLQQANEGYRRENDSGISQEDPKRSYKDSNHKPELVCAITPFHALKGFRDIDEIIMLMEKIFPKTYSGILKAFKSKPDSEGLKRFFSELLTMDPDKQKEIAFDAAHLAEKHSEDDVAFQWVVRLSQEYPGDIGVLSPVILNYVMLKPGEALFLAAGELHSYLGGLAMELMANSDNVIRGGLTPKYIDVLELLRIVEFKPEYPKKIDPVIAGTCEINFPTPAREFLLSVVSVDKDNNFTSPQSRSIEILICLEGLGNVRDLGTGETLELKRGASAAIPSAVECYEIKGNGKFYKASIP